MDRRDFLASTAKSIAALTIANSIAYGAGEMQAKKKRLAMVGTSGRGIRMWGKSVIEDYGDLFEFVGLCDINPGRMEFAKKYMDVACPVFADFGKMVAQTKPDTIIVTTVDAYHHQYITKGMELGCDIITEKPMTIDETKCQEILDAERKTKRKCIVTFNYRYAPHRQKIKELLMQNVIGKVTSVDFHWYLDTFHGADYFRRWHRLREKSGSLLVHKATHHFDLLNWWLDSDPAEVFAYGALEFYGRNNSFRNDKCRGCPYTDKCKYYMDITKDQIIMDLYDANEKY